MPMDKLNAVPPADRGRVAILSENKLPADVELRARLSSWPQSGL